MVDWLAYTSGTGPGRSQMYVQRVSGLDRREPVAGENELLPRSGEKMDANSFSSRGVPDKTAG